MSITVTPITPSFVAEISDIDLAQTLRPDDRDAIENAINHYAVVVFRGQRLTDDQQIEFSHHLGPLHTPGQRARHTGIKHRLTRTELADISNLDGDGKVLEVTARRRLDWLANRLWHTDASFRAVPGALSLLYAHVIPDEGGDTEFADLRAAYDALPAAMKQRLESLVAIHSIWHSRGQLDVTRYTAEELANLPPVPQRVVRTHPGSHRKTLYLAAHASHIEGMPVPDGRLLLMDLMEHATKPPFVHVHKWREGDLVIWDNRCTMHRARPFDTTKVRDLRRVTTRDVASTLEQAA